MLWKGCRYVCKSPNICQVLPTDAVIGQNFTQQVVFTDSEIKVLFTKFICKGK